mmetsp:Transcript_5625/g.17823  ORF Transcript_5625/g.17823 Transcript_5625/m.17823 type:complete len:228 (+) Transcript_5625:880-1563(+)
MGRGARPESEDLDAVGARGAARSDFGVLESYARNAASAASISIAFAGCELAARGAGASSLAAASNARATGRAAKRGSAAAAGALANCLSAGPVRTASSASVFLSATEAAIVICSSMSIRACSTASDSAIASSSSSCSISSSWWRSSIARNSSSIFALRSASTRYSSPGAANSPEESLDSAFSAPRNTFSRSAPDKSVSFAAARNPSSAAPSLAGATMGRSCMAFNAS